MGNCSSNKKIISQIKAQDEQLAHLINLNQQLTQCLNINSSKIENSFESPEFRQYQIQIDERFHQLENQISQIYNKLKKLNIFEDQIPEFTEIDEVQNNSFEKALENDFKASTIQNEGSRLEKSDKIEKSKLKVQKKKHKYSPSTLQEAKDQSQKSNSVSKNEQTHGKKSYKRKKNLKKLNAHTEEFIKLTQTVKSEEIDILEDQDKNQQKKIFEKKKTIKDSQNNQK